MNNTTKYIIDTEPSLKAWLLSIKDNVIIEFVTKKHSEINHNSKVYYYGILSNVSALTIDKKTIETIGMTGNMILFQSFATSNANSLFQGLQITVL